MVPYYERIEMIIDTLSNTNRHKVILTSRRIVIIDGIGVTLSPSNPYAELTYEQFSHIQTQMLIDQGYLRVIEDC